AFRPSYGNDDSEQFGSLTNPAVGVININTAPAAVLRALGLLSPTASNTLGGSRSWLTGSSHNDESDIASTLIASRDKTLVYPRPPAGLSGTAEAMPFMSTGASATPSRGPGDPEDLAGRTEHVDNDRFEAGVPLPVREQPGFRSV